jgi:hypothetical protein
VLVPDPLVVTPPGLRVIVHVPAGNPFSVIDPGATVQVGCATRPTLGAVGVAGCGLMTTFADAGEVHPAALVTV